MSKISISRSEFTKGWTRAREVHSSAVHINNAHRLLLFYAVENGLKAIIMRNEMLSDDEADFSAELHDIDKLLVRANATSDLLLKKSISIKEKQAGAAVRTCGTGALNQLWRYGCVAKSPSDQDLEAGLLKVAGWIEENIE